MKYFYKFVIVVIYIKHLHKMNKNIYQLFFTHKIHLFYSIIFVFNLGET